jgi:hypothetical protein
LIGLPQRAADRIPPELRAQAPTAAIVIGGMAVWVLFLLLML